MDGSVETLLGPRPGTDSSDLGPRPQEGAGLGYQGQSEEESDAYTRLGVGVGHVLKAMAGSAGDTMSEDQFSGPVQEELRKAKIIGPDSSHGNLIQQFNEQVLRPLIMTGEFGARLMGAGFGAYQAGMEKAGEEVGAPILGRDLAALPEAFMGHAETLGYIAKGRELGIIGDRADIAAPVVTPGEPPLPILESKLPLEPDTITKPLDIHTLARQIDPPTFQVFDALQSRNEMLREQINTLAEVRGEVPPSPELAALQEKEGSILSKVNGVEERLTKKQSTALADIRGQMAELPTPQIDAPEMAELRAQIQKNDYQMRDLAVPISKAYDEAKMRMPAPAEIQPETAPPAPAEAPKEILSSQGTVISSPEMLDSIAASEKQKLVAAGRPEEEANLASQLIAMHYQTFAQYFDGAKGTAEELYKSEAPLIEGKRKLTINDVNTIDFNQTTQGRLRTFSDNKTIVKLFKSADASTFIHETGHKWLSELMLAAKDDMAPQQLKDLVSATRKWLGVSEQLDMTNLKNKTVKEAHEKWATAFERYLYDGQAPTPILAKVFNQFRDWLAAIKGKVEKLMPISNDIKDVFDKLITPNPERQPVGKIEPAGKAIADIHEADAKLTPSNQADAVGDLVNSEIHAMVESHPNLKEAVNGPTIQPGLEGGRGGGDGNEVAGARPTEPHAGGTAVTSPSPEIGRGAGTTEGEGKGGEAAGPGIKVEETGGAGGATVADAVKTTERSSSKFIDKAGNIRRDTLNMASDVFQAIKDASTAAGEFMSARRGKLSLAEQQMMADELGLEHIDAWKVGQTFNAEQIIHVRNLMIGAAADVKEAMNKAFETGDPNDLLAFAKSRARLSMIAEVVSGVTAEAGRALAAFRNIKGFRESLDLINFLKETQGMDLFQMQQMAEHGRSLNTTHQIVKFMNDSYTKPDFASRMIYYYVNDLISGSMTHIRYSIGNAINAVARPLAVIPIAAAQGAIQEALGLEVKNRVYLGEAGAQLHAMYKGAQDGIRAGAEAFRSGQSPLLPGERVRSGFNYGNNPIIENWAYKKAVKEGLQGDALRARIGELVKKPDYTELEALFGEAISYPGRTVSAIHSFFKSLRYEQNIAGLAYRTATKEGLTGAAFDRRIAELTERPTLDMMAKVTEDKPDLLPAGLRENINDATTDALKELYMRNTEYGTAMYHLAAAVNMTPAVKLIVPFLKIGTEIINEAVEYSPAAVLQGKEVRQNLIGRGAKADLQRAKVIFGTSLMGATSLMVLQGIATSDGPTDPRERENWLKLHRPNSINIGNLWIPYQGLGHLGMLMRFSANVTDTVQGWDDKEGGQIAGEFFHDITRSILDESWMRGAHDMMEAMYDEKGPTAARFIRSFATNWLPYSVGLGQVARMIDPYQRKVDDLGSENLWGILSAAQAKVPLLSQRLMPRRDSYGEPIESYVGKYSNDPTTLMLDDLQTGIGYLPKNIGGVQLDENQYDDYQRIAGRYTKALLDKMASNPYFMKMKPEHKIDAINATIGAARKGAKNAMFAKYPDVYKQIVDNAQDDVE